MSDTESDEKEVEPIALEDFTPREQRSLDKTLASAQAKNNNRPITAAVKKVLTEIACQTAAVERARKRKRDAEKGEASQMGQEDQEEQHGDESAIPTSGAASSASSRTRRRPAGDIPASPMTAKLASLRAQNPTMSLEQARAIIAAVEGAASITPAATLAATPVGGGPVTTASLTATCK